MSRASSRRARRWASIAARCCRTCRATPRRLDPQTRRAHQKVPPPPPPLLLPLPVALPYSLARARGFLRSCSSTPKAFWAQAVVLPEVASLEVCRADSRAQGRAAAHTAPRHPSAPPRAQSAGTGPCLAATCTAQQRARGGPAHKDASSYAPSCAAPRARPSGANGRRPRARAWAWARRLLCGLGRVSTVGRRVGATVGPGGGAVPADLLCLNPPLELLEQQRVLHRLPARAGPSGRRAPHPAPRASPARAAALVSPWLRAVQRRPSPQRERCSCCQRRECTVGTWVGATVGRGGGRGGQR